MLSCGFAVSDSTLRDAESITWCWNLNPRLMPSFMNRMHAKSISTALTLNMVGGTMSVENY